MDTVHAPQCVQVQQAQYVWSFGVYIDLDGSPQRNDKTAVVTQDAVTGEALSVRTRDPDISESSHGWLERVVPARGALAALLAAVGGAFVARRRRGS